MKPDFIKSVPEEVAQFGANAALVLAHIRYRCTSGRGDSVTDDLVTDDDGIVWWRTSVPGLAGEIGLSRRAAQNAIARLGDALAANHFEPRTDQTRAYRPGTKRGSGEHQTVPDPAPNGAGPGTKRGTVLLLEGKEGEKADAHPDGPAALADAITAFSIEQTANSKPAPVAAWSCRDHPDGDPGVPCGGCKQARDAADAAENARHVQEQADRQRQAERRAECKRCDQTGWELGPDGTPLDPAQRCDHQPFLRVVTNSPDKARA